MLDILWNIGAFLVAFSVLVAFHEYGHFWAARRCGVYVETFSIGLGPELFSWQDQLGTRYVVSVIPLGGFVKMLDERIAPVSDDQKHLAFNYKSVWQRSAIIFAGPLANFILALLLSWVIFFTGVSSFKPVVVGTVEHTPAAPLMIDEPSQIVEVQSKSIRTYQELQLALASHIGRKQLTVAVTNLSETQPKRYVTLDTSHWYIKDDGQQDFVQSLGLIPYQPKVIPVIAQVVKGSPAEQAGLRVGDRFISINQQPYKDWPSFIQKIQQTPSTQIELLIERNNEQFNVYVKPEIVRVQDTMMKRLGVMPSMEPLLESVRVSIKYDMLDSLHMAAVKTYDLILLSFKMVWKLISGVLSLNQLGGPVAIAQGAGDSAHFGWQTFVTFLIFFSVNLGVLNLVPLPVLDGGHLMYNLYEMLRGKPLPEKLQELGYKIGAACIFVLMSIALLNDISRL
mgnify:CR=1 FL=1